MPRSTHGTRSKQNPGLKVEFSNAPPVAEYISTLQSRILAGTAADVFAIAAENKTNLINGKHVVDLKDKPFLKNVPKFNQTTYSGPDGAVYGMSVASWGAGVLWYRTAGTAIRDRSCITRRPT